MITHDKFHAIDNAISNLQELEEWLSMDEDPDSVSDLSEVQKMLNALEDLTVMSDGTQIPLVSVADWEVGEGLGSIRRKDMDRVATVTSDVASGQNSTAVLGEVRETLAGFQEALPPGYAMRYTGENEEQAEASGFLSSAFLAALAIQMLENISQYGIFFAVGVQLPLPDVFVAIPLVNLISMIPISLGGVGLREISLVSLLAVENHLVVSYSLIRYSLVILLAVGLAVEFLFNRQRLSEVTKHIKRSPEK